MVHTLDSHVTRHLVREYSVSPSVAQSFLLAIQLVSLDWLSEIICLRNMPVDDHSLNITSLEQVSFFILAFTFPIFESIQGLGTK
jgi:hypothetical protein